ncbi:MAG: Holliday junction branch migration protein RuvA [bacterium]
MIARLSGKVIERESKALIVDVNGVGYRVAVLNSLWKKTRKGSVVFLRIHHHITSDGESLYGFESKEGLDFFDLLLTVPSVGPRTAMSILEVAPPKVLAQAVTEEDTALLTKVSGVGRKTAERILVELKEKILPSAVMGVSGNVQQEAMEALTSIGFTASQAREAVQRLPRDVKSVEEAVKLSLQKQSA